MRTTSRTLIIVRGLPGAGKSTIANTFGAPVREADKFDGLYTFHESGEVEFHGMTVMQDCELMVSHAHQWCQACIREDLASDEPVAVVANTFVQGWEFTPYLEMAREAGARIVVIDVFDAGMTNAELAESNTHGVPEGAIARMRSNWAHDWRAAQDRDPMPPWLRKEE
jgi:predicted kinase